MRRVVSHLVIRVGPLKFWRIEGVRVFSYAIAMFCGLSLILFAAFGRFCPIAAMASCAYDLARQKSRARCNPKRRFMVPQHYVIRKRCLEIILVKRFFAAHSRRPRAAFLMIPSR